MELNDNEVHIWQTEFSAVDRPLEASYQKIMSGAERERQQRFRFDKGRWHYAITRALVRTTLSCYAPVSPGEWEFVKGEHGKPELKNPPIPLRFNVSHSDHRVVCAVMLRRDVGIDIENTERKNDVIAIADRFFSELEVKDLFALPEEKRSDRFFDYWTLKEAYMKARGEGISLGLGNFSFTFNDDLINNGISMDGCSPSNNIGLTTAPHLNDNPADWFFELFRPDVHHRMSLAVRNKALTGMESNKLQPIKITLLEGVPLASKFVTTSS